MRDHDDLETRRQKAKEIQEDLNNKKLSRRGLLQRLQLLGVGFGAAYLLGARDAEAATGSDGDVQLKSTNPALNDIIEEGRPESILGGPSKDDRSSWIQTAYRRVYFRGYRRVYGRYGRGYARFYRRFYRRYARYYRRFYRRFG